ncbi:phosphatidylinositol kinase- protein kinase tor1, partial [Dipsacomyces acuminosporus]
YSRALFSGRLIPKDPPRVQPLLQSEASQPEVPLGQTSDSSRKLRINMLALRRAWSTTQRVSKEDWLGWLNQFGVELLQQSPSPALRACSSLAYKHPQLNSDLFNAAFVSCWTEISGQYQNEIVAALEEVASNDRVPADILLTILGLAEFMERDEKQIPIDLRFLCRYAERCHALAKELHYQETEWALEKNYETIEKLIELNQSLDLHDAAVGILNSVRIEQPDIQESVDWYLKLQRWDEALAIYRRQEQEEGRSHRILNQQIRCLFEMSDWDNLTPLIERIWREGDTQMRVASANIAMNMAWHIGDMEAMEKYMSLLPKESKDRSFGRALLSVFRSQFDEAREHIREARQDMEIELTTHLTESYSRGYSQVFRCQLLTELEEVVAFKLVHDNKERQSAIVNTWRKRMSGIIQDVEMWQKLLRLRGMVVRPMFDITTWIKFINMCRKSDKMKVAKRAIRTILDDEIAYSEEIARGVEPYSQDPAAQAQDYARLKVLSSQTNGHSLDFMSPSGASKQLPHRLTNGGTRNIPLDVLIKRSQQPGLVYTYLKFKWASNDRRGAYQMIERFANDYSNQLGFDPHNPDGFSDHMDGHLAAMSGYAESSEESEPTRLLARFYFKKAEWLGSIQQSASLAQEAKVKATLGPNDAIYSQRFSRRESVGRRPPRGSISAGSGANADNGLPEVTEADRDAEFLFNLKGGQANESILESYRAATVLDRKWYKAWHSLALRHYYETQKHDADGVRISEDIIEKHVVPAVHGFFRAIQLSKSDTTLQDTLRLLTAWFNYSQYEIVAQAVLDGFNSVPIRTWLQVIPQMLARIHIEFESTSRLIKQLLLEVGKFHANAILFSLYVAARSDHPERSQAAKDVLAKLSDIVPEAVAETETVSRELIRITLLFPEMWREALDNASRCYYGQGDPEEMMKVLNPLHERARNPETLREYHFVQVFGNELAAAEEHTAQYFSAEPGKRNEAFMQQAWEMYYIIFRKIEKMFPEPHSLALKDTAPILLQCRDMHLAVPGTYDPDRELVSIASFDPVVFVYGTKQHPRRVNIYGSDGNKYTFVLKGHEDLRQDERVMQLFGLINSLLSRDAQTARRSLTIERYPVIPLSSNSGLIGFYPNCETIHELIRDYRESHGQVINLEQRMTAQFSPHWDSLTVLQKVESFEYALSNTPGNDLQRAIWYKSPNAETWLERRTNYTRSIAVMSIAGYILGLGDRHPSNIMMHSWTGKVVHIDFGDCFEIAVHREKFPEKIPFRLTRMIIMPMEVSSIEGSFKFTANHTMRVLRANRDSLMAVLEAFVFDPLVSWSYIQYPESLEGPGNNTASTKKPNSAHPAGTGKNSHNQQQLQKWNKSKNLAGNNADAGMKEGSRPDDRTSRHSKSKYTGLDGKGWQVGNPKARAIVKRISNKLLGTDFDPNVQLTVAAQIEKLIQQATSSENLAPLYNGWVPLW